MILSILIEHGKSILLDLENLVEISGYVKNLFELQ